jgi:glycosyltransferase involved in cell wall biosynthesis
MSSPIFLSILIPVYNYDVRKLLQELHSQAMALQEEYGIEIIVMDDGSSQKYGTAQLVKHLALVSLEEFAVNRGRVAIRNSLIERAKGDFILLLDADMLPDDDSFLKRYITQATSGCDIICGGISYLQNLQDTQEHSFYLYKSQKTEEVSANLRNQAPWRYLFTSNIMLRRQTVESVRFDPRFSGYGYEDIEWAIRLNKVYTITHIDNTCSHMGLMTKQQAFVRMRESINNYALLMSLHPLETAGSNAAKVSKVLKALPYSVLHGTDVLLSKLFFSVSWNPLAFVLFQCDKMTLLAQAMKRQFHRM